jgi:hypothetical protein
MPRSPYEAFALMTRQGAMGEDRGPLARRVLPGIAQSAPVLRSQLLARAERYEGLSDQLQALRASLQQFTLPAGAGPLSPLGATTPARSGPAAASPSAPAGSSAGPSGPVSSGGEATQNPAVLLATHAIFLAPGTSGTDGKAGTHARLETEAVALNQTAASLRGDKIQLNNKGGKTDFGSVTINGVETEIGLFEGTSVEEAARHITAKLNQNAENTVVASVDAQSRDRVVLTSKVAGSLGTISVDQVERDRATKGSIGFQERDFAQGTLLETDLGEVTINGVTTRFGRQTHASVQDAVKAMATMLNAAHGGRLEATIGGSDQDRLVLTSTTAGPAGVIAVSAVKQGTDKKASNDGNNGFTAGILARGSDSEPSMPGEPGFTDFGAITINGIATVFGRLDNRDYTAETAALFLATRINETNASVRATVEEGRLKLSSTETGPNARIHVEAIAPDSDGNRDNDRALGFVAGSGASGSTTTLPPASPPPLSAATSDAPGGTDAAASAEDVASGKAADLPSAQPDAFQAQAEEWLRMTNAYLSDLDARTQEHPHGEFRAFGRTIQAMLQHDSPLAAVGIQVEGGRLSLDEKAFLQAFETDPQAVLGAMQGFRETLDPLLASQAYAMDFMRGVAEATRDRIPEISQAKTMLFKLEQRSKDVSLWLESLEKVTPQLEDQEARLRKLEESDKEKAADDETKAKSRVTALSEPEGSGVKPPGAWREAPLAGAAAPGTSVALHALSM